MILRKKPIFKRYLPDEIRAMRKYLRESRERFADRFLMSGDAFKKYETGKREPWGPVIVILGQIAAEIEELKEERSKLLENVRNDHLARLTEVIPKKLLMRNKDKS